MPLTGGERPAAPVGPSHRTRHNHGPPIAVVPLVQHAGPQYSISRAGSFNEDQGQFEGDRSEAKASDDQGQS